MKRSPFFCVAALLMFVAQAANAEQGCPPGQIPHSGTSMSSCGPIPGAQTAPPAPTWYPHWQSVAGDTTKGALGTSKGHRTGAEATNAALLDCKAQGGTACKTFITEGNGCLAIVFGEKRYFANDGKTLSVAEGKTSAECKESDGSCRVYYSECDLPTRAQ
jgi:hypothetical protein